MNNNSNRRDDRRDSREPARGSSNGGEGETRWVAAGAGWPFREGEGFNIDVDWPIKQGSRLQLMPPKEQGSNRPWQLYELREKPKRNDQR